MTETLAEAVSNGDSVETRFTRFIEDTVNEAGEYKYDLRISEMFTQNRDWVEIDVQEMYNDDYILGKAIITNYKRNLPALINVIKTKLSLRHPEYANALDRIDLRMSHLPEPTTIHQITADMVIGKLIQTKGTVVQRGKTLVRPTVIAYECRNPMCKNLVYVSQTEQYRAKPEAPCPGCDGKKWRKIYEKSTFEDYQEIVIQELMENVPNGSSPDKIKVILTGSLIRSCEPGETVEIVGTLDVYDESPKSLKLELSYHITASNLINDTDAETIRLEPEDIEELKTLMSKPEYQQNVIDSIAPHIYGYNEIKKALAYQLCEGQVKNVNETRQRGQFHILLAGPPGCGKSELGDFMVLCHPKGRKAMGRGASGVGLTASVVKDGDDFVLRAGAMALADNGFLFVDEIEKMNQIDSGAMHPGMEQQEIHIDKADISAVLKTRCSILAACNPIQGMWINPYPINDLSDGKRGLPRPLLDRFALIFIFQRNLDSELERKVVNHIMKVNISPQELNPPHSINRLRKIFAYARTINVAIPDEIADDLTEFCMTLFEASKIGEMDVLSRRQPVDLIRISEASARLHGRNTVTKEDAENAKQIVAYSLKQYGLDPATGKIDQVGALYGEPKSKRDRIKETPAVIQRLCKRNIDTTKVSREEFIEYASKTWRCAKHEAGEALEVCLKDGSVFCPTPYTVATTVTTLDED